MARVHRRRDARSTARTGRRPYISYYRLWRRHRAGARSVAARPIRRAQVTLDDYMRAMWRVHGKPGGDAPGLRRSPLHAGGCRGAAGRGERRPAFARDFFARYVQGHEVADYAKLLARAGLVLRQRNPGRAWWGDIALDGRGGVVRVGSRPIWARLSTPPAWIWTMRFPSSMARRVRSPQDVASALDRTGRATPLWWPSSIARASRRPRVSRSRRSAPRADPDRIVRRLLTPDQRRFRESWLN